MKMPFGRHCGRQVGDLPDSYLVWLMSIDLRNPALRADVRAEAEDRGLIGGGSRRRDHWRDERREAPAQNQPLLFKDQGEAAIAREIVKSGARQLAHKHHPDHGGSTATMQVVNRVHKALETFLKRAEA